MTAVAEPPLSRALALRIGLAARVLPGTAPGRLLDVLVDCLGLPLREERFAALSASDLRAAGGSSLAAADSGILETALGILKGEIDGAHRIPEIQPYRDGDMPGSIRVAIASDDGFSINGHFASCRRFLIYQLSTTEARLIDIREPGGQCGERSKDKSLYRTRLIADCHLLYTASIGAPAAAKAVKEGIHAIKVTTGDAIDRSIEKLQEVIAGTPPPWLAKIMGQAADRRFPYHCEEDR